MVFMQGILNELLLELIDLYIRTSENPVEDSLFLHLLVTHFKAKLCFVHLSHGCKSFL